jgi:phenylacetate-CoA ligase
MLDVIRRLTGALKQAAFVDEALRYNPRYYAPVKALLRELDGMDRQQRRELADRLTQRTLHWASRQAAGVPASVPLTQRPYTEKSDLREHALRFRTPGLIRIQASTSGSTGIPVTLFRSLMNVAAEQAFVDELLQLWGMSFRTARMAVLRADLIKSQSDTEPPFGEYRQGGLKLMLSSNHLTTQSVGWYHDELVRFRPDVLFTHPSSGEALARFLRVHDLSLNIPVVLTSSEMLHPSGRTLMETTFRATVVDRYGLAERVASANGLATGAYFFNPAYGRVELLPVETDEAPPGRRAYEIVATGYWNDAMPLVRYRCNDRVIVPEAYGADDLEDVCLGLKPVVAIQGRDKEHIVSPTGQVIVGLTHATYGIKGLVRMQIEQLASDEVLVRVVIDPAVGGIDESQLLKNIYAWAPRSMRFKIQVVGDIERLPSGKTPFVIRRG